MELELIDEEKSQNRRKSQQLSLLWKINEFSRSEGIFSRLSHELFSVITGIYSCFGLKIEYLFVFCCQTLV